MTLWVKVAGTWTKAVLPFADNGSWNEVYKAWVKKNGVWEQYYGPMESSSSSSSSSSSGIPPGNWNYVRFNVLDTAAHTTVVIAEITVAETIGGTNVANYNLGGWVTFSSETPAFNGRAWRAFDGNPNTYWNSTGYIPQWIAFQFDYIVYPLGCAIKEIKMTTATSALGDETAMPTDLIIDASLDNISWTTLGSYSGLSWVFGETKTFTF